jgi:tRNA (guanine-N7-)-methyltransferase
MNSNNKLISVKGRERPLSKKQKQVFVSLSKYEFDFSLFKDLDYPKKNKIFLEIGFGSGEIIFKEAKKNPNNIYIGIEYYRRGVAQLLKKIEDYSLKNIKIFHGDAHKFLEKLSGIFFDEVWLFFPDPWPKKRHEKRRFIQKDSINKFNEVIKPEGSLYISSDDKSYIAWTLSLFNQNDKFEWLAEYHLDWEKPYEGYYGSRYEKKGIKKSRKPYFLKFKKLN